MFSVVNVSPIRWRHRVSWMTWTKEGKTKTTAGATSCRNTQFNLLKCRHLVFFDGICWVSGGLREALSPLSSFQGRNWNLEDFCHFLCPTVSSPLNPIISAITWRWKRACFHLGEGPLLFMPLISYSFKTLTCQRHVYWMWRRQWDGCGWMKSSVLFFFSDCSRSYNTSDSTACSQKSPVCFTRV